MQDSSVSNAKKSTSSRVPGQDTYSAATGSAGISVAHYDLDLDYRVTTNRLTATATILIDASADLERFTLDLVGLTAQSVTVEGGRARFTHSGGVLTIVPARTVSAGTRFTVAIRYTGAPSPRRSAWGEVGWEELSDGVLVAGQPNGAPTWFPCNDHPSDKATYRIAVTAASSYRVVANGTLTSTHAKSSRTRSIFETTEPMATYLATLQIGAYRERDLGDTPVRQLAYLPDDLNDDFDADFGRQRDMIDTFVALFGPYPFEQYSVVVTDDELEIPLEAQGMSVFGRNHVDGNHGSDRLIAHELAHSWFGNSLTVSTWRDIWLHEGFACYAEWLWSEASGGASVGKLADQHWHRLAALPQDLAIGDPGPARMFDDRVYKRGALALHSVRLTLGDTAFFDLLRAWTAAHRHGSVSTEQFLDHVDTYARSSLRPSLNRWLFTHPLPRLER